MLVCISRCFPHRYICLNAWIIESHTARRYGIVVVGVVLLEEECHLGAGFEFSYTQTMPSVGLSSLSDTGIIRQITFISFSPAPYLPVLLHDSHTGDNCLNL